MKVTMPQRSIKDNDLKALLQLNLLDVIGLAGGREQEKTKYLQKFNELVWTLFFQADGKDLSEDELEKLKNLLKDEKYSELDKYFEEKFPKMKARVSANSVLAKEIVIAQHIGKLLLILKKSKVTGKESLQKELNHLAELVSDKRWEEFSEKYKFLDNLREKLNG